MAANITEKGHDHLYRLPNETEPESNQASAPSCQFVGPVEDGQTGGLHPESTASNTQAVWEASPNSMNAPSDKT